MDDVSFSLHYGEIVGIAGVQGNGQTELVDIISGMNTEYKGRILLGDQSVMEKTSPLQRRRMGLGHIPEDRQIAGSAPEASIEDNFAMTTYRKPDINHFGFISRKKSGNKWTNVLIFLRSKFLEERQRAHRYQEGICRN